MERLWKFVGNRTEPAPEKLLLNEVPGLYADMVSLKDWDTQGHLSAV